jgi:hypothetical protein
MKKDNLYHDLISLFIEIKLIRGPLALSDTLRRHKAIALFLDEYQKTCIIDLESNLLGKEY